MNNDSINKSDFQFFDAQWYLEENPDVASTGIDPLNHFKLYGWKEGRNPSKYFDVRKYIEENQEIIPVDMDPFSHLSFSYKNSATYSDSFPTEAIETSQVFKSLDKDKTYKRVYVVASFIGNGVIPEYLLYFLAKIKKSADAIIFIADNPIKSDELQKLSRFVNYASFSRHEEYDFGSYKRGIEFLADSIGLENVEELVLCNDSCIGPIFPVSDMFLAMDERIVDFWGITSSFEIFPHLQPYFLVFKNNVIKDSYFLEYFKKVKKEATRSDVILKYELLLTSYLEKAGYKSDSYVPYPKTEDFASGKFKHVNITTSPFYLFEHKCPFIKLKHFYEPDLPTDNLEETCKLLVKHNPNLGDILLKFLEERKSKKTSEKSPQISPVSEKALMYEELRKELKIYRSNKKSEHIKFSESQIIHKYLDGLNGIEIGASDHSLFGLDKTGCYEAVASGDYLSFKDESLDYVISSQIIERVFDPIKTIEEWFRVVKKGGYVVMIVAHKNKTIDKLRPLTSREELNLRHSEVYTEKNYMCKLENTREDGCLPHDFMRVSLDGSILDGYECAENQSIPPNYNVWNTLSFVFFCKNRNWKIADSFDCSDNARNSFMVILQKLESTGNSKRN